jgi:hypothetical protein
MDFHSLSNFNGVPDFDLAGEPEAHRPKIVAPNFRCEERVASGEE